MKHDMTFQRTDLAPLSNYAIETHGLTKKFGSFTAVDHIDLAVPKGEIYGFLGPNGAGKSTTIRMLCTLLKPTSGTGKVAGFNIDSEANEVRKRIGLVSEKLIMYTRLTAEQNLMFFGKLYGMDNAELKLKVAELLDMMKLTPFKDRSVGGFSSGMRQRMNLIRALIHDPEIIFLDEPTTALDPQSTKFVRDTVLDLKRGGHTIILTTHIMEEADELSDKISIIDHGKIMATGTVAGLKEEYGTQSMLEVFLTVTGRELRDSASDRVSMKAVGRM
jgi:ABC-2 type transport system ATP-binding protein